MGVGQSLKVSVVGGDTQGLGGRGWGGLWGRFRLIAKGLCHPPGADNSFCNISADETCRGLTAASCRDAWSLS